MKTDKIHSHTHKTLQRTNRTQQVYHHSPSSHNLAKKRSDRAGKQDSGKENIAANIL